jgi:hypothetical protein
MNDTMKAAVTREKALASALTLSALVLGGTLYWEWTQGLELQQQLTRLRTIPVTPVPEQNILPEFSLPEAETGFPELLSRNLFAGNRRSVASAGKDGRGGSMKKGQFVLVGVLITPQQRSALLRDVQTNKTETVALVAQVRGMTLGEVEPSRVVLRQGAESEELILNVQIAPKGAGSQAAIAPPVPQAAPAVLPARPASAALGPAPASQPSPVATAASSAPGAPGKAIEPASRPKPLPAPPTQIEKK